MARKGGPGVRQSEAALAIARQLMSHERDSSAPIVNSSRLSALGGLRRFSCRKQSESLCFLPPNSST